MIPFSILDLAPIVEGGSVRQSLLNSRDLARHADKWGYHRLWLAEHHNIPGVASAATSVMIAYVGEGTTRIRLGAGGIMLPNHAPMLIAEQFGTLEAMYPGRIDLALGRAPGGDGYTARALRRTLVGGEDRFPRDVMELQAFLAPSQPGQLVRAIPGEGSSVPLYILGSSTFGAHLAAALGLPFAFASHFAPALMMEALAIYRANFKPSKQLDRPHAMLGFNLIAADTDEEAERLSTSLLQVFVNLRRGTPTPLPPPKPGFAETLTPEERAMVAPILRCSGIGSPATVKRSLETFIEETGVDELILAGHIHDHAARLRSYEIASSFL